MRTENKMTSLLLAIRTALTAKPHWSVFGVEQLADGQLVFHAHRDTGDVTREIRIEYRPALDTAATVVVVFTEAQEEDANKGLYDLLSTAYNLMKWVGSQVTDLARRLPSGQDDDAFVIVWSTDRPPETVPGTWKFNLS